MDYSLQILNLIINFEYLLAIIIHLLFMAIRMKFYYLM